MGRLNYDSNYEYQNRVRYVCALQLWRKSRADDNEQNDYLPLDDDDRETVVARIQTVGVNSMGIVESAPSPSSEKDNKEVIHAILTKIDWASMVAENPSSLVPPVKLEGIGNAFASVDEMFNAFVVVTCEEYPVYTAMECVEELTKMHYKHHNEIEKALRKQKDSKNKRLKKPFQKLLKLGKRADFKLKKLWYKHEQELHMFVMAYDNLEAVNKIYQEKAKAEKLRRVMEANIRDYIQTVANQEDLLKKAEEANEMAKVFTKNAKKLRNELRSQDEQFHQFGKNPLKNFLEKFVFEPAKKFVDTASNTVINSAFDNAATIAAVAGTTTSVAVTATGVGSCSAVNAATIAAAVVANTATSVAVTATGVGSCSAVEASAPKPGVFFGMLWDYVIGVFWSEAEEVGVSYLKSAWLQQSSDPETDGPTEEL